MQWGEARVLQCGGCRAAYNAFAEWLLYIDDADAAAQAAFGTQRYKHIQRWAKTPS